MMDLSFKNILKYISGMIILAIGLTLNTKTTLGVSPILSLPYAIAEIASFNFADLVFVFYCVLIIIQMIIHLHLKKPDRKLIIVTDFLQIAVSLIFTRIMNVISSIIPVFETQTSGFYTTIPFRLLMLGLAIILTGIGAAMTLDARLIPNPGDGVVAAFAELTNKPIGTCKNIIDITFVFLTCIISLIMRQQIIGVGIGTLIAMLGVGRVIAFVNAHFLS